MMFDWFPTTVAQLQWNYSFGLQGLATVWIGWMTLRVLQSTKGIQGTQIELLKAQNKLIEQQTIASTALATIAQQKEEVSLFNDKITLLEHLTKMLGYCTRPDHITPVPGSYAYVEKNYPIRKINFSTAEQITIHKVRQLYVECCTARENLNMQKDTNQSIKTLQEMPTKAQPLEPKLFEVFKNIRTNHFK